MNDWRKIRSKNIISEIVAVSAIIIFIVVGLWWQFSSNTICGKIDNNFAMVILQIQATVDTLTIAIIALISGSVSDSNMGIAFRDYYLNIRPLIFKQKKIIVSSILLLVINIGLYIVGWYCLILWVLAVTVVLILMSVNEIYLIFNGKRLAEKEIKDFKV